jgi:hypothetical protein
LALSRQDPAVFRLYADDELGKDGYPRAWHQFEVDDLGIGVATVRDFGIKHLVRANADHRCIRCGHPYQNGAHGTGEWSPCDEKCGYEHSPLRAVYEADDQIVFAEAPGLCAPVVDGTLVRIEAQWRILTVHHANGVKADCRWWNLLALCQRCHFTIQGRVDLERAFILEHSEWFRIYAAGWYALKYEDRAITREEAAERMDELLSYERLIA